jgi:hypothetical protein
MVYVVKWDGKVPAVTGNANDGFIVRVKAVGPALDNGAVLQIKIDQRLLVCDIATHRVPLRNSPVLYIEHWRLVCQSDLANLASR